MESRYKFGESTLSKVDRLGLAFCRLNSWEWDEIIGPKPEGFDDLPDYDRYHASRVKHPIIMKVLSRLFPYKYARKSTKHDYLSPAIKGIESEIGEANTSRCWWKFSLGRTEEEWRAWYYTKSRQGGEKMVPKIEINTKGINTRVCVNGEELKNVRAVHFTHEAGKLPIMTVDYVAADLYLDGEFVPALPHPFEEWYEHKEAPPCEGEAK